MLMVMCAAARVPSPTGPASARGSGLLGSHRKQPERCAPASLAAELRVSLMRTVRRMRAEKSDRDLTDTQYAVLVVLERLGPKTPGELADHERVQPPSMTRIVAALAESGLVTRTRHSADRRQIVVALTSEGVAVVRETRHRRDAWLDRRLAELAADEREVLARASEILRRIAAT